MLTSEGGLTRRGLFRPPMGAGDLVLIGVLAIVAVTVLGKDISVGGLRDGDTAVHAMDGVLIHDWIAAGPEAWRNPMKFAEEQYAHYPCLGIGRHYPPGFAMVEAVFFAVFGISPFTARLCVVFFGVVAAAGAYVFMRTIADRPTSVLGAVALMTLPAVTFWGRQAMLEVPTLAVLAWGAVTLSWYLHHPSWGRYAVLLMVATAAILFRQTGVFLHSAIAMTLVFCALRRTVRPSHGLVSVLLAGTAIVLVTMSFEGAGERMLQGRASYPSRWDLGALTFYLRELPEQVGYLILTAAAVGFVVWPRRCRAHWVFLGCWFFVAYVMLSAADLKWPRFLFVALFPFAVWASVGAGRLLSLLPGYRLGVAGAVAAVVGLGAVGLARPVRYQPDYGVVVAAHKDQIREGVVLAGGVRDNHFVFAVRQHLPPRQAVVVRSSKLFYVCNTIPAVDFESFADTSDDLAGIMRRFAFDYVFVERENRYGIREEALLNEYLRESGMYRHVAEYPLQANRFYPCRNTTIDVYEPARPLTRAADHLDIPVPRSNRTIRLDLRDWSG